MNRSQIDELFRISKHFREEERLFRHLKPHEELMRAVTARDAFGSSAVGQHRKMMEELTHARLDALHGGIAAQFKRQDELLSKQWQSAFAVGRIGIEDNLRSQIMQMTEGFSSRSVAERTLKGLRADIGRSFIDAPNIGLRYEKESLALWRTMKESSALSSAASLASLSSLVNATATSTIASLAHELREPRWMSEHTKFVERMYQPSSAYNRFATRTLAELGSVYDESRAVALAGSLLLANEQAIRSAGIMQPMIELSRASEVMPSYPFIPPPPIVNRYRIQRDELLEEEELPEEPDYETLVPFAPSAQLFEQARRCLELVGMCNETSQTCRGEIVFKLTPMLLLSFSGLLSTVASNRLTLTHVVENLYIVLYEAAGKDSLRYITGGYVTKDESEIVWRLKHLRNKWLSHDADHGKEADIKKDWRKRMDALQWLGVERMPTTKEDYSVIHQWLLNKVEEFLSLLLTRIAAPTTPKEGN